MGPLQSRKDQIEDVIEEISERIIFHDEGFNKCRLEPKDKLDREIIQVITKLDGEELYDVFRTAQEANSSTYVANLLLL